MQTGEITSQHFCKKPNKSVTMVVKVTAKCCNCSQRENFYVNEKHDDNIDYHCKHCGCDKFLITFR